MLAPEVDRLQKAEDGVQVPSWAPENWTTTRYPGVEICFLDSNRETGYAAVLIRMQPGAHYPAHRHRGTEELFVLEGAYEDAAGRHEAGSFVRYEAGTAHHPRCPEDSSACVFFAIAREGIELFGDAQGS